MASSTISCSNGQDVWMALAPVCRLSCKAVKCLHDPRHLDAFSEGFDSPETCYLRFFCCFLSAARAWKRKTNKQYHVQTSAKSRVRLQFGAYTPCRAHHFRWPFYLVFQTREGWTLLGGIPCDRSFLARFQASRVTGPPVCHRAFVEAM